MQTLHGTQEPRVLYLYAGARKEFYAKWRQGLVPDTQLLGHNYMAELGVNAEFKEWRLPELLRKVHFNLVHLPYIFAIKKYDVVFICAGLPLVFLAKYILRWKKPRFVIYNTYLSNALARNPRGLSGFITRKAIEGLDCIVCTAKSQTQPLIDKGVDPQKIVYHPIGIDAEAFFKASERPEQAEYILSVGRDVGRDYKTLFAAARNIPAKFVVATKKEAIEGLEVPQNVEIKFHVPYEDMPALYQKALFVVTPLKKAETADGSETSGQYGYLEPMASGKAVITARKDTVLDYVSDGADGILYEPESATDLEAKIKQLLASPETCARLGSIAQKKVRDQFTSKKFAAFLAEQFKKLK